MEVSTPRASSLDGSAIQRTPRSVLVGEVMVGSCARARSWGRRAGSVTHAPRAGRAQRRLTPPRSDGESRWKNGVPMDSGATTPDPTQPRDARARLLPPGFPWRALILLALLALALRVGTSLTRIDEFNQEGLAHGTRTRAMLEGVPLLPSEAPRMIHFRSSILMSWISVPFF